ncbi:hypothetical protein GSI_04346 [Ganoderma sinense ZZ0214-1]|uniref:Uncharacterized protein n=1 Tax=Ganoderma sinense ZZ0214-1 TaxID=1077348 RepID=A0A2G8SIY4_9APHY|nr:hypothetical protein GSI_04346 [Ganoderma sinense ZZ0214-1]
MAWGYAVIRINPTATVLEDFGYPDILEAARAMRPKPHLVFLESELALSFPHDPWYPYAISPITPCPPPMAKGHNPEMCVPVFPNTHHRNGREAVRTDREFPYNNCYHWSMAEELKVRVRAKPENFDDGIAVHLPARELMKLWDMTSSDRIITERACKMDGPVGEDARLGAAPPTPLVSTADLGVGEEILSRAADEVDATALLEEGIRQGRDIHQHPSQESIKSEPSTGEGMEHDEDVSESHSLSKSSDGREVSIHSAASEFRAIVATGIFGLTNEERKFWPMVDLWLELADYLKQEDIPDPHELYREYEAALAK